MITRHSVALLVSLALTAATGCSKTSQATSANGGASATSLTLLNVSYDPTRELYQQVNEQFAKRWQAEKEQELVFEPSHGASGKQARFVIDGLKADVVTLALAADIDEIAKAGLLAADWQKRLPHNSSPYTSTQVFLVRKGNPKGIKDWDDLVKEGVEIVTPNPKTSGGARWAYLAAWGYALKKNGGDETKAREFVTSLYQNVQGLDPGARDSTTKFVQHEIGDVLLSWENEAFLAIKNLGPEKYEIVYPSVSILAEPPVAVVDENVDEKGTREAAEAYLKFLYTKEGQELAAKNFYRPSESSLVDPKLLEQFPDIELFTIDDMFGGWSKAQSVHFGDGGEFDAIAEKMGEN